jgi:hypothetical protein
MAIAVGVASERKTSPAAVDAWKRQPVSSRPGADIIIPHYLELAPPAALSLCGGHKMPYPQFDRTRSAPQAPGRPCEHDLGLSAVMRTLDERRAFEHAAIPALARAMVVAKHQTDDRAVMLSMGAHVLRCGNARFIIDLMRRGLPDPRRA